MESEESPFIQAHSFAADSKTHMSLQGPVDPSMFVVNDWTPPKSQRLPFASVQVVALLRLGGMLAMAGAPCVP